MTVYGRYGQYPLSLHLMSCGKHARLLTYHRPNTQWVVDVMAICALLRKYISLSLAPPGLVLGLHLSTCYNDTPPPLVPAPGQLGLAPVAFYLLTTAGWRGGRAHRPLYSLYIRSIQLQSTVHSYSLQLDTPICSDPSVPGTESGPDPRS